MNVLNAIIMGIVQGLTEFLPISSSGHLVLIQKLFGITENTIFIDVALHLATLIAVVIVFFKDIKALIKAPLCKTNLSLAVTVIPTATIVITFKDIFEESFNYYPGFGFLFTAIILIICSVLIKKQNLNIEFKIQNGISTTKNSKALSTNMGISYKTAFLAGIFQGGAAFPGVSRSGSTITALLASGVQREDAVKYSFLMSIPVILASMIYELFSLPEIVTSINWTAMIVGFVFALITGIFAIKMMLKIVKESSYKWFAIYLALLSLIIILNQFVFHLF